MTKLTYFRFDLNILILLVFIVIAFFNFNEINSFSENKLDSHIDLDKSILPTFQNKNQDLIKNRFFYLELNKMSIPINFFSIQDNLINNVIYEKDKNSLILILNPTNFNNNSLIIDLPRSIINAKNQDNKDNNFTVLLDNKSSKYLEIHDKKNLDKILNPIYNINTIGNTFDNANDRELLIQFDKDTKVIKIIGSNMSRDQNQIQIQQKSIQGIFPILDGNKTNYLKFHIEGGYLKNIFLEQPNIKDKTLELFIDPFNINGSLIIDLPRSIINAKNQDNKDNNFTVLLDNKSSKYLEIHDKKNLDKILNPIYNINTIGNTFDNANDRELLIQFDKDTKVIKIIGSNMSRDQNQIQIHSFYKYNFIIPIILPITITISLILIYVFYKKKKKNFTNLFKYKRDKNNKEK